MSDTRDDDLRDLYQELILDHYRHPSNFRDMPDATRRVEGDNPLCGDRLELFLRLDGDRIARLRILAPTEWNFHPEGAAARALASLRGDDRNTTQIQANLLIHAIDPCVGYELGWKE